LSVTVNVPVRAPAAVGVKVTEIAQLAPAPTEEPHVFVSAKSPEAAICVTARAAAPPFDKVTTCAALVLPVIWLLKVSMAGLSEACGASATPVPLKVDECGDPEALSVTVKFPVRAPAAVGVKVTAIAQFAPAATADPQVFVSAKSPDAAIWVIVSAAVPLFDSVTVCLLLATPTFWLVKISVAGLREACGEVVETVPVLELEHPPRSRQQARAASWQREPKDMSFYPFANTDRPVSKSIGFISDRRSVSDLWPVAPPCGLN
jgi:hypothetical protein